MNDHAPERQSSWMNDTGSALHIQDWEAFNTPSDEAHQFPIDALYTPEDDPLSQGNLPDRIRINGQFVLGVLRKICGPRFPEGTPVMMFRLYKALLHHNHSIRTWAADLQDNIDETLKADPTAIDTVEPSSKQRKADKQAELDQLKVLLSLMDDLSARADFLQTSECDAIRFSDLYLLYRPGDVVVSQDCRQAYRIFHIECERKIIRRNQKVIVEDGVFVIHCVYIDFDGERLGPVLRKIVVQPWCLTKAIHLLDVLPLKRAELKQTDLASKLAIRGATFVKAAGISPMHYIGRTLDSNKDINSTVIIDFQEAIRVSELLDKSSDEKNKKKWRPDLISNLKDARLFAIGFDECEEQVQGCPSLGGLIFNDSYVAEIKHQNFVRDQLSFLKSEPRRQSTVLCAQLLSEIGVWTEEELIIMNHRVYGFIPDIHRWGGFSP